MKTLQPSHLPPALTQIAVPWLLLAIVDLVLHLSIPEAGLRNGGVPLAARLAFAALGLLALLVGVTALVTLVRPLGRMHQAQRHTGIRSLLIGLRVLVVGVAVLIYGASWATFWNTGTFLDSEAMAFWLGQPIQVFHWVYPPLIIGLAVAISVSGFALAWLTSTASRQPPSFQSQIVLVAGGLAAVSLVLVIFGVAAHGWTDLTRSPTPLVVNRAAHAGPLVHAVVDAGRRLTGPAQTTPSDEANGAAGSRPAGSGPGIERRPIVSMQEYLARVDPRVRRPLNVVMVQVESLRSDQLRAYGGTRDVMPTLDGLAAEARVFTNAYVQSSHSNYADVVPLSSHYPLRSAFMYDFPENPPYPRVLIYDVLKAIGYRTGIFSSQNEGWGGMIHFHRPSALDRFFHAQTFRGPTYAPWEDAGFASWVKETGAAGSVDDRFTVDEAIKWVDTVGSQPFFLHMNLQNSHLPYVVPPDFRRPFGPATLDFTIMWGKFPLDRVQTVKDRYADSLFYADTQIARLFNHLRMKGLWENTIIIVGGDNGEAFYEHGFAAHASWLFNEVVKVPMIFRVPGLTAGVDGRPAMFLDVPPSVFDVLGLPSHPSFQGVSLFAPNPDPDRSMFMISQTPMAYETAIVRGRYKLHFAEAEKAYFLNDLVADPGETTDISPRLSDVVAEMTTRLQRWRAEQLAYYASIPRQQREYPPFFRD